MNFSVINKELKCERLTLRPISPNDRLFINQLFTDDDIKRYYIVPKEAQQDYKRLVDYWLTDNKNEAGTCWIISEKDSGLFSRQKPCGFIAFEFRDTLNNARISYAVLPKFRRKGIATLASELVINTLKSEGVLTVEADIDRDNSNSERVVEKLGFKANKRHALVDPEMLRDGEVRMRALWKKYLVEVDSTVSKDKLSLNATTEQIVPLINTIVEEIKTKGQQSELMLRYFYLLGRIKFIERNYEEARGAFGQCNMMVMKDGLFETHLYFYWLGKINEEEGEKELALSCFNQAKDSFNKEDTDITLADIDTSINALE